MGLELQLACEWPGQSSELPQLLSTPGGHQGTRNGCVVGTQLPETSRGICIPRVGGIRRCDFWRLYATQKKTVFFKGGKKGLVKQNGEKELGRLKYPQPGLSRLWLEAGSVSSQLPKAANLKLLCGNPWG